MSKFRQRSIFGVLVIVLGALLFLVSSAFVIDRGYPKVLAAIVGGLAFPVLPVAWQIWGERKRNRKLAEAKKPSKSTLTGFDRFWLRFVGVVILIVGPMVAVAKLGVVHAAVKHALWVIPEFEPGLGMIGEGPHRDLTKVEPLLKRIPSDAEAVILATPASINGEGVLAYGTHDVIAAAQGNYPRDDDEIRHINDGIKANRFNLLDPIQMVIDRDITVAATEKWKTKVEPAPGGLSPALRAGLERSPSDASFVAAFTGKGVNEKTIRSGAVWAVYRNKKLIIEARIDTVDVRRAYEMMGQIKSFRVDQLPKSGDCRSAIQKSLDHAELAQIGNVVDVRIAMPESFEDELRTCFN